MANKRYLGDSVYAAFNGSHIVLTTEDGISVSNTIYLDDHVFDALVEFAIANVPGSLGRAIKFAETVDPLPRCRHGSVLVDGAGERLEPLCGCRAP